MVEIYHQIHRAFQENKSLVLATIIDSSGSTPRGTGSKMVVYADGSIAGTIGGGAVEADVINTARTLFAREKSLIRSYNLSLSKDSSTLDLVCGGTMQIVLEYLSASPQNREIFATLLEEMDSCRPCILLGEVQRYDDHCLIVRSVIQENGRVVGPLEVSTGLREKVDQCLGERNGTVIAVYKQKQYIVEALVSPYTVYIVGAGHIGKEVALLTTHLGFRTIVFDDRQEFADIRRFPGATGVCHCPGFQQLFAGYTVTSRCSIVIVTSGHHSDREALLQALQTEAGYIGMIGSRRKRAHIYQSLRDQEIQDSQLQRVCCPVGLPIQAETPGEIGISIVAQLIQHRAGGNRHG